MAPLSPTVSGHMLPDVALLVKETKTQKLRLTPLPPPAPRQSPREGTKLHLGVALSSANQKLGYLGELKLSYSGQRLGIDGIVNYGLFADRKAGGFDQLVKATLLPKMFLNGTRNDWDPYLNLLGLGGGVFHSENHGLQSLVAFIPVGLGLQVQLSENMSLELASRMKLEIPARDEYRLGVDLPVGLNFHL